MNAEDDPFESVAEVRREAERLLGLRTWLLLSCYGRVTAGPGAGWYVGSRPFAEQLDLVHRLARGETVSVHLMHRHRLGYETESSLRWTSDGLVTVFCDGEALALEDEVRQTERQPRERARGVELTDRPGPHTKE